MTVLSKQELYTAVGRSVTGDRRNQRRNYFVGAVTTHLRNISEQGLGRYVSEVAKFQSENIKAGVQNLLSRSLSKKVVEASAQQMRYRDDVDFDKNGSIQFTFNSQAEVRNFVRLGGGEIFPKYGKDGSLDGYAVLLTGDAYVLENNPAFKNFVYGSDKWNEKRVTEERLDEVQRLAKNAPRGFKLLPKEAMEVGFTSSEEGRVDGWLAISRSVSPSSSLKNDADVASWVDGVIKKAQEKIYSTPQGDKKLEYVYTEMIAENKAYQSIFGALGLEDAKYENNTGDTLLRNQTRQEVDWVLYEKNYKNQI